MKDKIDFRQFVCDNFYCRNYCLPDKIRVSSYKWATIYRRFRCLMFRALVKLLQSKFYKFNCILYDASVDSGQAVCIGVSGEVKITWSFSQKMAVYTELATREGKVLYVAFVKAALRKKRLVFTEVPNFSIVPGLADRRQDR